MKIRNHNKWIILALVSFFRVFEKPHPVELGLVTLRALFSIGGDSRIVAKQTFPIVPNPNPQTQNLDNINKQTLWPSFHKRFARSPLVWPFSKFRYGRVAAVTEADAISLGEFR